MPKTETYELRPLGWEQDPEEERIPLTSLDYLAAMSYNSYAIYFKVAEAERPKVVDALRTGLERTLSQCRQLVGTIEKNAEGVDHSFVKKRDSVVPLVVEYWDDVVDVPSLDEIEKANFATSVLGEITRFSYPGMYYGELPHCHPDRSPRLSAYKANFIKGGLFFVMNSHHYCHDIMSWAWCARQLAGNCAAAVNGTTPPAWDPAAITDGKRFIGNVPSAQKVDGPTAPELHPELKEASCLLFHLPRSKAAELKKLASSADAASKQWISTYDAFMAQLWRLITRHRAALYGSSPDETPLFSEAVNYRLRNRLDRPVAEKYQRNLFWVAASAQFPDPLTVRQITDPAVPLHDLAAKIRAMTASMDQAALDGALAQLAAVRDKTCLFTRVNSFPPLSLLITDWREAGIDGHDFGFGKPRGFRHLFPSATQNLMLIFPPRATGLSDEDEGPEFALALENDALDAFLADEDFTKYFEHRGYELDTR